MRDLSTYIAGALKKPLPREVVERAKLHLVDTFAAMISGSRLVPGRQAAAYVRTLGGKADAGVVGTRIVTSPVNAALANGMSCHADESDDTHPPSITHPGMTVVPAALAIAERDRLPGAAMLRAMVLGYDICTRLVLSLKPYEFRKSGHYPVSFGAVFGAAATAGALLKLNLQEIRYMLSYAAQQTAGLSAAHRDLEHVQKAFAAAGMAAHNGTAAALMAAQGFTGIDDIFSGAEDFFFTFVPDGDRREELTRGLGRDYEILRVGIKCFAAGGPIQAPLHVLQDMIREHGFNANSVEKLTVWMPDKELEVVNNRDMPSISVQHLLAVMLADGKVDFAAAHDDARMKDPRVLALKRRVKAIGNPLLTDPLRRWRCVMEVTLKDGRRLKHQTMAAKGGLENPLTRREGEEKALDLIVPVLGKKRSRDLLAALWKIDQFKNVRLLRKFYAA
jgi:2-methylcitrate dehydratase PrpD